ncbi:MAG: glycosyltransferase family 2 protein [Spirosomataceae bacterium]
MKNNIKISVLMAVYNTDFFLIKRAIDSVLNQTFQNFELIVIDDGSNNATESQLLHYAQEHEDRIVYIRHKNCGQSKSINRGLLNSSGDFITILDADDEYQPNHLMACLEEMSITDLIASTPQTVVDSEEDYFVPDKYDPSQLIHVDDCILFATLFGKREVFVAFPFQDAYAADAHFYETASLTYRVKKVDLRTYIYYRNIPTSICSVKKKEHSPSLN